MKIYYYYYYYYAAKIIPLKTFQQQLGEGINQYYKVNIEIKCLIWFNLYICILIT